MHFNLKLVGKIPVEIKVSFWLMQQSFFQSLFLLKTSKTTFNNDQPRSGKEKDLWLETHSVLSSYLLIKHIPSGIMGQFPLLGPPKKDFGVDNFFYWANITHHLF